MLLLKKHLVELVRAGKKRQTIRYWSRPCVRAGQISYTPGLGKMKIVRVDELAGYQSLTLTDARNDGFETLEDLLAELRRHYPEVPPGKRLYRVVFEWPLATPISPHASADRVLAQAAPAAALASPTRKPARKPTAKIPASPRNSTATTPAVTLADGYMSMPQRELLRNWIITQVPPA
jgi:hypothetical protein